MTLPSDIPAARPAFVGRDREMDFLDRLTREATGGRGQLVFIEGGLGLGKSSLVEAYRAACSDDPTLGAVTFLHGGCHETTGHENAYQPFADTLSALAKEDEKSGLGRFAKVFVEVAPDWLAVVPVIGPALHAGAKTVATAGEWYFDKRKPDDRADSMARQYIDTIRAIATERPLVLVLEEAQWIDPSSCQLLSRLAGALDDLPILVLVTYRMDDVPEGHPLRMAMYEAVARHGAHQMSLSGFEEEDCQDYLVARYGADLDPGLPAWLMQLSGGRPLFISRYLTELEHAGVIRASDGGFELDGGIAHDGGGGACRPTGALADIPVPAGVEALIGQIMERLVDEEEELLQQGAVQGDTFLSRVLAELTDQKEINILAKLRRVAERHRLIALRHEDGWYSDESEAFQFEHPMLHKAFYDRLAPRERQLYHDEIASILEQAFHQRGIQSRQLTLEIAHHYDRGGQPLLAAGYHYQAGRSSFRDGAFLEAAQLCELALGELGDVRDESTEIDELRAKTVLLHLICSSHTGDLERKRALLAISEEGEAAAERAGADTTLAEIRAVKGHFLVQLGELDEGLETFQAALDVARAAGDPAIECVALLHLGAELAKKDLAEGVRLRREAYDLYQDRVQPGQSGGASARMDRYFTQLLVWLGIGEFDLGNLSEALRLLSDGAEGQRALGMTDDLIESLNFLGQTYAAIGQFERGEEVLREAIALEEAYTDELALPWLGNNLALLGKLYIEWERVDDATEPIIRGREIAEHSGQRDLVSIVRNYHGELLMHPEYASADLDAARECLEENATDCLGWGMERSAVTAYTLLAALELGAEEAEAALAWSDKAIGLLEARGEMPAARTEEILFNHARALEAHGRGEEAEAYRKRALEVLDRKATTIEEEEHRKTFLERVPISREIARYR